MKEIQAIMATSHVDLHRDRITLQALEGMARQIREQYLPMTVEHDIRYPPIGRIVSAEVIKLPDGKYALQAAVEQFEETDSLESLTGDGRRIPVRCTEIQTIAVEYDRSFRGKEEQELLSELSQICGEGEKPTETVKKALDPVVTVALGAGVFIVGSIATGFFSKVGADIYERLRDGLTRYYRKKIPAEQILDFRFSAKHDDRTVEVHVLVINPSEREVDELLSSRFEGIDTLLLSFPLAESDIAKVVLEWKNRRFLVRYAVRGDCVPLPSETEEGGK